jgi:hypothetical protein
VNRLFVEFIVPLVPDIENLAGCGRASQRRFVTARGFVLIELADGNRIEKGCGCFLNMPDGARYTASVGLSYFATSGSGRVNHVIN